MAQRYKISVEIVVPMRADDDDSAIEKALDYLARHLAAGVEVIESSAVIVEDED